MSVGALATKEEVLAWKACALDVVHFLDTYASILDPTQGPIPFRLWSFQRTLLRQWQIGQRYGIILKSRQLGITWLLAGFALWLCKFHVGKTVLLISRRLHDANKFLWRVKYLESHLPDFLRSAIGDPNNVSEFTLIEMESSITSLPATEDTGRSESASLVILDEAAHGTFQDNDEKIWSSIEPLAQHVLAVSTANGYGNWFARTWAKAMEHTNQFTATFLSWRAHPFRDAAWYAEKKKNMPLWALHQEYPTTAEEAFVQSGRPVFDILALNAIAEQHAREPMRMDDGVWRWKEPTSDGEYVVGVDVSEGVADGDYSYATVTEWKTGEQVAELHGQWPPEVFARKVYELTNPLRHGYRSLIGVERNNHGHVVVLKLAEWLAADEGMPLYVRLGCAKDQVEYVLHALGFTPDQPTASRLYTHTDDKLGWLTTAVTKPVVIDGLEEAIRKQEIVVHSQPTILELRAFAHLDNGKMGGSGANDDRVMGMAIAWQLRATQQRESAVHVW